MTLPRWPVAPAARPSHAPPAPACARGGSRLIGGAFAVFNSLRVAAYVPTLVAIAASGDSSQHSLWTWGVWLGANLSTALWLHERGDGVRSAVLVAACNAAMCAAAIALIVALRV